MDGVIKLFWFEIWTISVKLAYHNNHKWNIIRDGMIMLSIILFMLSRHWSMDWWMDGLIDVCMDAFMYGWIHWSIEGMVHR